MRRHPDIVVLLDEIEKAHPDVFLTLLQVLEDGRLTDSKGRTVDFTNTLIVMTSNLRTFADLKSHFRPELINRLDEIITFDRLAPETLQRIVDLQLLQVEKRLLENQQIGLVVSPAARAWLGEHGYDEEFGARPLRRVIEKQLLNPLSELLLAGKLEGKPLVRVDARGGELVIEPAAAPAGARGERKTANS